MAAIEKLLMSALEDFKKYSKNEMGYADENLKRCVHGASAFVDYLLGKKPKKGQRYN